MNLKLIAALNRRRLRRKVAQERARLDEMRENSREVLSAQAQLVADLEGPVTNSVEIAHRVTMRAKARVLGFA